MIYGTIIESICEAMNYQQALDYLYSFPDSEAKLPRSPAPLKQPPTAALLYAHGGPPPALFAARAGRSRGGREAGESLLRGGAGGGGRWLDGVLVHGPPVLVGPLLGRGVGGWLIVVASPPAARQHRDSWPLTTGGSGTATLGCRGLSPAPVRRRGFEARWRSHLNHRGTPNRRRPATRPDIRVRRARG